MIDHEKLENVDYFKYMGSMMTNDEDVHVKLQARTAAAKKKEKTLFTRKLEPI
jgi:N-acetylmuramoyl-L-alanine amidase